MQGWFPDLEGAFAQCCTFPGPSSQWFLQHHAFVTVAGAVQEFHQLPNSPLIRVCRTNGTLQPELSSEDLCCGGQQTTLLDRKTEIITVSCLCNAIFAEVHHGTL
jgi:hypothetical protein